MRVCVSQLTCCLIPCWWWWCCCFVFCRGADSGEITSHSGGDARAAADSAAPVHAPSLTPAPACHTVMLSLSLVLCCVVVVRVVCLNNNCLFYLLINIDTH